MKSFYSMEGFPLEMSDFQNINSSHLFMTLYYK